MFSLFLIHHSSFIIYKEGLQLVTFLTYIISFAFVLGVLVLIHEFGHFIAAKRAGVRVEVFSVGFGPRIWGFKKGDTDYRLSLFPLGGYVKLPGENPDEATGAPWELTSKSPFQRLIVFAAGSVMNILAAIVFLSLVFFIGTQVLKHLDEPPIIGWVDRDSPAQKSGFQVGDRILRINGKTITTWEDAYGVFLTSADISSRVEIEREGKPVTLTATPEAIKKLGAGYIGLQPPMDPVVGGIRKGLPADKEGLKEGDKIIAIDGVSVNHWLGMAEIIQNNPDKELEITILRDGVELKKKMIPQKNQDGKGILGIEAKPQTVFKKYGVLESIHKGLERTWEMTIMMFDLLGRLVKRQASTSSIGGPLMIADMAGKAAKSGISELLGLMGALSLNLGIINLLPIPVLDGGHIAFLIVEMILGRPLSVKKRELAQKIGLAILIPLMILVFHNDIMRLLGR
jgi:regulator of sigma E protease